MLLKGSIVALVTPMNEDGSLDKQALNDLVEWHIANKTDALVVAGTTGEAPTLNSDEQLEIISLVVKQVAKRIPVIAGTGSNSTRCAINLTQNAKQAGVDACLVVTPYYNKPTQRGLYEHYRAIAEAVDIPIILYNVPGRTACDILPDTVKRLSQIKNIIGIKEASGNVERAKELIKVCGESFPVYSGDDATGLDFILQGAQGVISVTANITPLKMHDMCKAAAEGNLELAKKLNTELMSLHERLFLESNPIPTKWALHTMGKIKSGIRLPLSTLDNQFHQAVKEAMQKAGVN